MVAGFIESFFKEVMTKAAGLRKTVHAVDAMDVHPPIGCGLVVEFIFLYDFLRNVTELYLGKFGSFEGCHEVEVGKIDAHEMSTQCGNRTVEEYLDEE